MPTQAAQTFAAVIAKPAAKLQADAVLASTSIFTSFASDEDLAQFAIHQDQCIVVRPKSLPPDAACQAGGGRNSFRLDPTITVSIWNRLWIDQVARDDSWLTDSTLGTAAVMQSVMNSLEQYMPTDSSGNYMLIQPMRLMPSGWTFPAKRIGEWGIVSSDWFFPFQLNIS